MNLETNIEIEARSYMDENHSCNGSKNEGRVEGFIAGAKSDSAREYWKDQFKLDANPFEDIGRALVESITESRLDYGIRGAINPVEADTASKLNEIITQKTGRGVIILGAGLSDELGMGVNFGMSRSDISECIDAVERRFKQEQFSSTEPLVFSMRPEIKLTQCFSRDEPKPYDRKYMPNRKTKKRK